jgi:hypothetical protein
MYWKELLVPDLLAPDVVEGADVRVVERGDGLRLALDACPQLLVARQLGGQQLDRHRSVEPRVTRAVDLAHASGPDRGEDLVGPETGGGGEPGCRVAHGDLRGDAEAL